MCARWGWLGGIYYLMSKYTKTEIKYYIKEIEKITKKLN